MSKFDELSIADLIAAEEYVQKLKNERSEDLKSQGIDIKDDNGYESWDKLSYDIHTHLFSRLVKLKNK